MFRLNVPASFNDCLSVKEQIMWLFFHKEFTLRAGANVTITREGDETIISAKGDGFAPIVRITTIPGGHRVTVIDGEHPQGQSFDVMDGVDGQDGRDGQDGQDGQNGADGEDGTSIIVKAVNTVPGGVNLVLEDRNGDHTIFLTNGPEGPQGATGPQGPQGIQGETGAQGPAGFSPTISSEPITGGHRLTITDITGTSSVDVLDGENAAAATIMVGTTTTSAPGGNASVVNSGSSSAAVLDFTIPRGAQGPQGVQGPQGIQGIQGETGPQGPAGPGVAAGGTAGQVLSKVDGTDYNTEWINPPEGGGNKLLCLKCNDNAAGAESNYTRGVYNGKMYMTPMSDVTVFSSTLNSYVRHTVKTGQGFNGTTFAQVSNAITPINGAVTLTFSGSGTFNSSYQVHVRWTPINSMGWCVIDEDGTVIPTDEMTHKPGTGYGFAIIRIVNGGNTEVITTPATFNFSNGNVDFVLESTALGGRAYSTSDTYFINFYGIG